MNEMYEQIVESWGHGKAMNEMYEQIVESWVVKKGGIKRRYVI
jgi:hypothetical protein